MRMRTILITVTLLLPVAMGCFLVSPQTEDEQAQQTDAQAQSEAAAAKPTPGEKRDPEEERRRTYLNVVRLAVDISPEPKIKVTPKKHPATVGKYSADHEIAGAYYLTKQGVLLCESGPCSYRWTAKFAYTDETGATDAFLLQCSATVFGGMTPSGTGRSKLDWCINGDCESIRDLCHGSAKDQVTRGRYTLTPSRFTFHIRRADIAKEIVDAGRRLADY